MPLTQHHVVPSETPMQNNTASVSKQSVTQAAQAVLAESAERGGGVQMLRWSYCSADQDAENQPHYARSQGSKTSSTAAFLSVDRI